MPGWLLSHGPASLLSHRALTDLSFLAILWGYSPAELFQLPLQSCLIRFKIRMAQYNMVSKNHFRLHGFTDFDA